MLLPADPAAEAFPHQDFQPVFRLVPPCSQRRSLVPPRALRCRTKSVQFNVTALNNLDHHGIKGRAGLLRNFVHLHRLVQRQGLRC